MATLARPFRPWEIVFDLYLGLRPPAADYDLGYHSAVFQTAKWWRHLAAAGSTWSLKQPCSV